MCGLECQGDHDPEMRGILPNVCKYTLPGSVQHLSPDNSAQYTEVHDLTSCTSTEMQLFINMLPVRAIVCGEARNLIFLLFALFMSKELV